MEKNSIFKSKVFGIFIKILLTAAVLGVSYFIGIYILLFTVYLFELNTFLGYGAALILPGLLISLIWVKDTKKVLIAWGIITAVLILAMGINIAIVAYEDSITVDTSPNIRVEEYMPFKENSKIVPLPNKASLKLTEDLPRIDGAAAVFPVYSAFINAVYPETTTLYDGAFEYNNTVGGYHLLAQKKTDIFFGAYPSDEQIAFAKECGTEFVYTPIGKEAFVFFVHKDNPINNLTTEQIQGIYAGEITNWSEVGGNNEEIMAYQRNEGSGSQSQLIRFMNGKELMDPPAELVNDLMSGIIEQVSDYRSKSGSIGFSFRYYVEGIIQNPDIKILSVDGVYPTVENIKNGSYPLGGKLYAVTYKDNPNPNVQKLLDWVLSEEGQYIIEKTGYVGIN